MTTVITAWNTAGRPIARCDASCHHAKQKRCFCICGGINHGVGDTAALNNTADTCEEELRATAQIRTSGDARRITVNAKLPDARTLSLFPKS